MATLAQGMFAQELDSVGHRQALDVLGAPLDPVTARELTAATDAKDAQAVQLYQQLIDKPTVFVPKVVAMLALADHYSKANPTQAANLYQQVKAEFPNTQAAQEADQRLQLLPAKS